jgi:hypothetical protein
MDAWIQKYNLSTSAGIIHAHWKSLDEVKNATDQDARYVITLFPQAQQDYVHRAIESIRGPLKRPPPRIDLTLADKVNKLANVPISEPELVSGHAWDSADDSSDVDGIDLSDYSDDDVKAESKELKESSRSDKEMGTQKVVSTLVMTQSRSSKKKGTGDSLPQKSGFMEKRGSGVVATWRTRYFTLFENTLFWFKSQDDPSPRGFLKLTDPDVKEIAAKDGVVAIVTRNKTYKLRSCDGADVEQAKKDTASWADVMSKVREAHAGATNLHSARRAQIASFQDGDAGARAALAQSSSGPIGRLRAATALRVLPKDKSEVILSQFARLIVGSVLQKIKYRRRQKRFVYLSQKLDTINWSQLNKKDKPKGSLSVSHIVSVKTGIAGVQSEFGFTIFTAEKGTVSFEAESQDQQTLWVSSLKRLVELCQSGFIPLQLDVE